MNFFIENLEMIRSQMTLVNNEQPIEIIELQESMQNLEIESRERRAQLERERRERRAQLEREELEIQAQFEREELERQAQLERERTLLEHQASVYETYNEKMKNLENRINQALREENEFEDETRRYRKPRNLIVTSETQNGKTQSFLKMIKEAEDGTLTVVSCDNKGDQREQLQKRLIDNTIPFFSICWFTSRTKLTKKMLEKLKNTYENEKKLVIILLNNNSQ